MGLTIKNVTNLARAGRVIRRVQAWFHYNYTWTFTCNTTVFTGDHWAFRNLRIDPSNCYISNPSSEILAVQDRFPDRFNRGLRRSDLCHIPACQQFDWYESIKRPTITTLPSSPRRGEWTFSTYASWSARRVKKTFDSDTRKEKARKNAIEQTFFNYSPLLSPRIKNDYYFLPWNSSFEWGFLRTHFF